MSKEIEELSTEIALLSEAIKGFSTGRVYTHPMAKDLTRAELFAAFALPGLLIRNSDWILDDVLQLTVDAGRMMDSLYKQSDL
jgi:hypothetical protein